MKAAFLGRFCTAMFLGVTLAFNPACQVHAQTVLRTLAYHQITAFATDPNITGVWSYNIDHGMMVSADGRKIVFQRQGNATNYLYTVNFDGTGLTMVDAFSANGRNVDISADGSKVMAWDFNNNVRVVNSDGSNLHQVIQITGYLACRLSADGSKIFFMVDRSFSTTPDTGTHEAGWYVVNADGTGLREIVGATSLASFFGVTVQQLIPSGILPYLNGPNPNRWGVSADGSKMVIPFDTPTGWQVVGFNTDGTGLHGFSLAPTINVADIRSVGISGDGTKIYYFLANTDTSNGDELGVFNWDGSGRRVLFTSAYESQVYQSIIQLNHDGSKLLFGNTGYLMNTDGSGTVEVDYTSGVYPNAKLPNAYDGIFTVGVMSSNATRFVYFTQAGVGGNYDQLATVEINPASLGLAPALSGASVSRPYMVEGGSSPLFTVHPSPTNGLVAPTMVAVGTLLNGVERVFTRFAEDSYYYFQPAILNDAGINGDVTANDGVYSDNQHARANYYDPTGTVYTGPRTLRYVAESLGTDGNYHATAIDAGPFFIMAQAPSGSPPTITSIAPAGAGPGAQVTINGTGFDPIATNNYILFGNQLVPVISANGSTTQIVVQLPTDATFGTLPVTVSSLGQSSGAANFTVTDPLAASLTLQMLAGLQIYGAVSNNYQIQYLANVQNTNSWSLLSTITLPSSPYFWVDVTSTNQPQRFYRAVRVP